MNASAASPHPAAIQRQLWTLILAVTAIRLALAWLVPGFVGGDDVEILEAGFRRGLGLDFTPWAIRNLLLPEVLVAPVVGLAHTLGVRDSLTLVLLSRLPFVALASLNVGLLFKLARRLGLAAETALVATALYALHWLPLGYGATTYPRTAAVTCLLAAAILLTGDNCRWWSCFGAGALVAVAFACRYSEVVFLPSFLLLSASPAPNARARWGSAAQVLAGFAGGTLLAVGLYDWISWGRPFASLLAFAHFTLVEGASSSRVAVQPPWWYLWRLPAWLPLTLLPLLVAAWRRRWWPLWGCVLLPLAALSVIHHKELRYLQGLMPFLMLLAAVGHRELTRRWRRGVTVTLLLLSGLWGLVGLRFLARTSGAAVEAARHVAAQWQGGAVALSQAWAYGHLLHLGGVPIRDLGTPPDPDEPSAALPDANWPALYAADIRNDPRLPGRLRTAGFREVGTYGWAWGRRVVLWARHPQAGPVAQSGLEQDALGDGLQRRHTGGL